MSGNALDSGVFFSVNLAAPDLPAKFRWFYRMFVFFRKILERWKLVCSEVLEMAFVKQKGSTVNSQECLVPGKLAGEN